MGGNSVGGISGNNIDKGTIENAVNKGAILGGVAVGGIVGENSGSIRNTENSGNIIGVISAAGGIVGRNANGKFFQAVSFSGKHQAGLAAVVKGDVQVAPISDAILAAEINAGRVSKDDVKIIFASDPIPSEPMALRRDLPAEVKEKVKNFILSYDNAAYYKGVMGAEDKRFVECSIEDYKGIIDLNKALSSSK